MQDYFLTSRQVRGVLGEISDMTLWRYRQELPDFPEPVKIRGANYWRASELESWMEARSAARHTPSQAS